MNEKFNVYVSVDDRGAERCIRKFKRMCESYGIQKEYRNRKEYKKPSIKKKEKDIQANKKRMKTEKRSGKRSKI
ncbi:MAG: 30S ribosomal protein S21 [Bacteriovoracaceae bacterium]|nr:30S ribosomal protein S21 [Bacteriovoracaceae bacterium]